jgi:formylmethanofuran dehydrogenase subunit B
MAERDNARVWHEVPSPFCGVASDDLTITVTGQTVSVTENGDALTIKGFETPITDVMPRVDGQETSLANAVLRIAQLMGDSQQTLISGLGTDLNGARSAMALADKGRATVDHMNSSAVFRNLLVLQDTGWMNTTFAEVRNRVDLLLIVGSDIESGYPRFFERMVWPKDTLFGQDVESRVLVYLGKGPSGDASTSPKGKKAEVMLCDDADLPEVMSVLRALISGRTLQAKHVGGIEISVLADLAQRLKAAQYSVVTWSAAMLDFEHAEVTVQMLCELVKDLNTKTRSSGLPLSGKEGDTTVNHVAAWQSGYPMRTNFNRGHPDYDPYLSDGLRMLAEDEVDTLIWVSSFDIDRTPPLSSAKTVVLGRSGMTFEQEPEVFIPVGTPGIDHAGRAFRTDSVVSMPLRHLRESGLPSTFDVLSAVEHAI